MGRYYRGELACRLIVVPPRLIGEVRRSNDLVQRDARVIRKSLTQFGCVAAHGHLYASRCKWVPLPELAQLVVRAYESGNVLCIVFELSCLNELLPVGWCIVGRCGDENVVDVNGQNAPIGM